MKFIVLYCRNKPEEEETLRTHNGNILSFAQARQGLICSPLVKFASYISTL